MKKSVFLFLSLGIAIGLTCKVANKTRSPIVGLWQAKSITIANISLDLITDSLSLPIEYHHEHTGVVPGSSKYYFDSLVLTELKNQYKNSVMANQVEFNNIGQFRFLPKSGDAYEGTFHVLSKNQIELVLSNDSTAEKPTLNFALRNDLLRLSQAGEKELEVVYKRIK